MTTFLDRITADLLQLDHSDLSNTVVVMPGKHAPTLLKKKLATTNQKPIWSPKFYSLPELAEKCTGLETSSRLTQLILLYKCHYQLAGELYQSLELFMQWAGMALDDFNEIDHHLLQPEKIFSDLRNIGEIQSWSLSNEELTPAQKKYIQFWDDLGKLYSAHCKEQKEQGKWTYAALVRQIATEQINLIPLPNIERIYFVGHASYSPAEYAMMQRMNAHAEVRVYRDQDPFYFSNIHHEAGYLLRKQQSTFDIRVTREQSLSEKNLFIDTAETTSPIAQLFDVCSKLSNLPPSLLDELAIVLPDNSLADPLCTMLDSMGIPYRSAFGLPLQRTNEAKAISAIMHATKSYRASQSIYIKDLFSILELISAQGPDQDALRLLYSDAMEQVMVYLNERQLKQLAEKYAEVQHLLPVFEANTPELTLHAMHDFLHKISHISGENSDTSSALHQCIEILNDIEIQLQSLPTQNSVEVIFSLWKHLTSRTYLPYSHESSGGVHLLDMSETLALDFKTLYFLSANEGSLPPDSFKQSLIPADVRAVHKLPLSRDTAALTSYLFYRSLHGATNVFFYHTSAASDGGSHERSRYILQLEYELGSANKNLKLNKRQLVMHQNTYGDLTKIETSDWIKERLRAICEKGLSPSAIKKFNNCKLDFFYRYVLGLGEEEELEEDLSSATIGSIVHKVLENFYQPFKNYFPTVHDFENLQLTLTNQIEDALESEYTREVGHSGFNVLVLSVIEKMLRNFIHYEVSRLKKIQSSNIPITLKAVELPLEVNVGPSNYKIRGFADRIEEFQSDHYILDYKTGKVDKASITINKSIQDIIGHKDCGMIIQMLCYIYCYSQMNPDVEVSRIKTGFYSFRNHSEGWQVMSHKNDAPISASDLKEFENALLDWIKQLIETPVFEHNTSSKFCSFCRG